MLTEQRLDREETLDQDELCPQSPPALSWMKTFPAPPTDIEDVAPVTPRSVWRWTPGPHLSLTSGCSCCSGHPPQPERGRKEYSAQLMPLCPCSHQGILFPFPSRAACPHWAAVSMQLSPLTENSSHQKGPFFSSVSLGVQL